MLSVSYSGCPLSIILVGIGGGLWDAMREFDDNIPTCALIMSSQFVNFTIMSDNVDQSRKEAEFALAALMEWKCLLSSKLHWSLTCCDMLQLWLGPSAVLLLAMCHQNKDKAYSMEFRPLKDISLRLKELS